MVIHIFPYLLTHLQIKRFQSTSTDFRSWIVSPTILDSSESALYPSYVRSFSSTGSLSDESSKSFSNSQHNEMIHTHLLFWLLRRIIDFFLQTQHLPKMDTSLDFCELDTTSITVKYCSIASLISAFLSAKLHPIRKQRKIPASMLLF